MRDMGIDEAGMAEIEVDIVANPTHPMIRGLKGARKDGSFLHDGCVSQE